MYNLKFTVDVELARVRSAASIFTFKPKHITPASCASTKQMYNLKFTVDVELAHVRSAASIFTFKLKHITPANCASTK
jgi:hypothetical protein